MGRRALFVVVVGLGLGPGPGCTVQPDGGMNFNPGDSAPPTANEDSADPDDDGDDDEDGDDGSSSGGEDGTTGGPSSADGGSTFGPLSESDSDTSPPTTGADTGGGESTGPAELSPAYGPCADHDDCDGSMACLTSDPDGDQGFCSPGCGAGSPPNTALCPEPPMGVTATKECIYSGFLNTCVLNCNGGLTCPDGTTCGMTIDGYGPFCFAS